MFMVTPLFNCKFSILRKTIFKDYYGGLFCRNEEHHWMKKHEGCVYKNDMQSNKTFINASNPNRLQKDSFFSA